MSLDYDSIMRQRYDEEEVCRHGYRAENCGKCNDPDIEAYEPIACLHGHQVGDGCADCQVEAQMWALFDAVLRRAQEASDEAMGAAMLARHQKGA